MESLADHEYKPSNPISENVNPAISNLYTLTKSTTTLVI